jgi:hypothetical protein
VKTTSALAEFALWVSPHLHYAHADLQFSDRFRSQRLPAWAAPVLRNGAQAFCDALAHGCALDAAEGVVARSENNPDGAILRPGQACVVCTPLATYPVKARRVTRGTCADAAAGLRSMTEAECVGFAEKGGLADNRGFAKKGVLADKGGFNDKGSFAEIGISAEKGDRGQPEAGGRRRSVGLTYLGAVVEPSEPSGCLLWGRAKVEFNSHVGGAPRSCDLTAKHGACVCAQIGDEGQADEQGNGSVGAGAGGRR